jgi:hypothetical protein
MQGRDRQNVPEKDFEHWRDGAMILHCSYEELNAVTAGIERMLADADRGGVAAPPDVLPDIEALVPRLTGDIDLDSLTEQQSVERALEAILAAAREYVDEAILAEHPAAESSVQAYFDFAHTLTLRERVRCIGEEMRALIELMTGEPPSEETASSVQFEE